MRSDFSIKIVSENGGAMGRSLGNKDAAHEGYC